MSDCLFCKIIDGTIPSIKVYEDEHAYAFMEIMPVTKGHTLLIPKTHCTNLFDMTTEVASNFFAATPKVATAIRDAFDADGLNTLNNNGAGAGQTIFHYHLHLIPRYDESDGVKVGWETRQDEFPTEVLQTVAAAIKEQLEK